MQRRQVTIRIRILSIGVALVGALILTRLYFVQIVHTDYYTEKAERQYVHTKADLYSRGSLFFTTRDGEQLSAAAIQAGYVLAANPTHITDPQQFCAALKPYLDIDEALCVERASLSQRTYVELAARLSNEKAAEVETLDLDGALLYRNQWRYYPGGSVAARTIGFVGYTDEDGSELKGKFGLERYYDETLFKKREVLSVNFFAELFSNVSDLVSNEQSHTAGDVVTTLEPAVSRLLDSVLQETNDFYKSKITGAIIMDPKSGAIYAMNAVPTFDLNTREKATIDEFRNPLVEDLYEFGSTIKALTVAAGLDSGAITRNTTYYDSGSITLNEFTIRNFDGKGRGTVPMQEVLNQSLNTGVSFIVTQMGKERFRDYFLNYGLGEKTGIDLPSEASGLVENLKSPRDVEYATASFGQGIALTPIEITRALAVLANGGKLVTPHVGKEIRYEDGTVKPIVLPEPKQVLRPETSEEISRMLSVVVDDALQSVQKPVRRRSQIR
jgi:cell division protein FtsI/penicillin-binding protein 2